MAKAKTAGTKEDPTIRFASLTLDEEEYKLAYSFAAIAKAEKVTGCNLLLGVDHLAEHVSESGFPASNMLLGLFWAALSVAHPDMTMNDASVLMTPNHLVEIYNATTEAHMLSRKDYTPKDKKKEAESLTDQ